MRHYEIIYIVNPNLSDEDCHEIIKKYNDIIESQKGIIIKMQEWGKQRMAYTIKKFYNGYYVLIDFCADPGVSAELERNLKLDDRILKFQTVKLADKADPQELIQKEKDVSNETKESATEEDPIIDEKQADQDNEETIEESEVNKNGEK
jgi:small subunit ribosomal protein S6